MDAKKVKLLCQSAVFAAIIYVFTAYFHVPSHTGYTHIGDGFLYLAASVLPSGYAVLVGAVGAVLSDGLTGYAIWAPGSVVIKALTALCFTAKGRKILNVRNVLALLPSFLLCAGGYYLYEALITGNFVAPLSGVPGYCTQVLLSAALYLLVGAALDRIRFKERLFI